mmetsp:Transcript_8558/g.19047  ORF Transcript_8558/g.19047 Transcript_8558/m.19047 type:complete len:215 (-) Transcript_8558:3542-4186(-)
MMSAASLAPGSSAASVTQRFSASQGHSPGLANLILRSLTCHSRGSRSPVLDRMVFPSSPASSASAPSDNDNLKPCSCEALLAATFCKLFMTAAAVASVSADGFTSAPASWRRMLRRAAALTSTSEAPFAAPATVAALVFIAAWAKPASGGALFWSSSRVYCVPCKCDRSSPRFATASTADTVAPMAGTAIAESAKFATSASVIPWKESLQMGKP